MREYKNKRLHYYYYYYYTTIALNSGLNITLVSLMPVTTTWKREKFSISIRGAGHKGRGVISGSEKEEKIESEEEDEERKRSIDRKRREETQSMDK